MHRWFSCRADSLTLQLLDVAEQNKIIPPTAEEQDLFTFFTINTSAMGISLNSALRLSLNCMKISVLWSDFGQKKSLANETLAFSYAGICNILGFLRSFLSFFVTPFRCNLTDDGLEE